MRFAFGEDEVRRIAKTVKTVEQQQGSSSLVPSGPRHTGSHMSVVKVTATGTPYATGFRLDFSAQDANLLQLDAVKIKEVGGRALTANSYYIGFFTGYYQGIPVFLVSAASGTGGSGSGSGGEGNSGGTGSGECFDVIQSISCTDGELSVTYATICPDSGTAVIVGQQTGNYSITTKYSVTGGGKLNNFTAISLVNDVASPTSLQYYGTNSNSVRGWYDLPSGAEANKSITGKGTVASPLEFVNDKATPGNLKLYGTDGSGVRGWFDIAGNQETSMSVTGDGSIATPIKLLNDEASPAGNYMYGTTTLGVKGWVPAVSFDYVDPLFNALDGRVTAIENAPYATQSYVNNAVSVEATNRNNADIALDGRITTLEGTVVSLSSSITTINSTLTIIQGDISNLNGDISTINNTLSTIQSNITTLQSNVSTLQSSMTTAESNIATLQSDVSTLQTGLSTAESNITTLQTGLTTAEGNITTLQSDVATLQTDLATAQSNIATLQTDLATAQSDIATLQSDLATAQSNISTLQSDYTALEARVTAGGL